MAITATSSAASANAYATLFKTLNAASSKTTFSTASSSSEDPQALLKTATNSVFAMSDLMKRVKVLSNTTSMMRSSDANGLATVTKSMNSMLDEFSTIGVDKAVTATADKAKATPTLAEVQSTLTSMQNSLRENIRKVGASSIAAVANGAFINKASSNNADQWSSWVASLKVNQKYLQS